MIKGIVGAKTYAVWIDMLRRLGPHGRTHRLAVLIAGMMHITMEVAQEKESSSSKAREFLEVVELVYEGDDGDGEFIRVIEEMLKEAKMRYKRINSRGQKYSVAEDAMYQFVNWDEMPWRA